MVPSVEVAFIVFAKALVGPGLVPWDVGGGMLVWGGGGPEGRGTLLGARH